jgi:hypothetical protein
MTSPLHRRRPYVVVPDELAKALRADYERIGVVLKSVNFKPE